MPSEQTKKAQREIVLIERIEQALRDAGLNITIGGCGCCGSPWIVFEGESFDQISIDTNDSQPID